MSRNKVTRAGGVYTEISFTTDEIMEEFISLVVEELEPVAADMEARAKELCPVGRREKQSPMYSRAVLSAVYGPAMQGRRKTRERITIGSKRGYMYRRDYRNTSPVSVGVKWQSRQPGRLRASIRASVAVRNNRSAVLLFLEAGDEDSFYAPYVELGTYKMQPHPFIRPAFNEYRPAAARAVHRALERLGRI